MAAWNICFCVLMAMIAVNMIIADDEPLRAEHELGAERAAGAEHEPGAEHAAGAEHEDRLFFGPRLVSCNYTAQAGSTCPNCRQALRCLSSNVGLLRTCRFLLPYCNNGRCSFIPGSACNFTG